MQFVFRHPFGMIIASYLEGIAAGRSSLLVADPRLSLAVTGQNKENMVRDFLVDLFQHRFVKLRIVQPYLEHFDLGHCFARRNIQCRRCQLITPVHQPDLIDKHTAQSRGNLKVLIELLLRYSFVKFSRLRKTYHF